MRWRNSHCAPTQARLANLAFLAICFFVADHAVWQVEATKKKKRKRNKKKKENDKQAQARKQELQQKQKMLVIADAMSAAAKQTAKQTAHPIVSPPAPVNPPTSSLHKVIYIIEIQYQSAYSIRSVHTIFTD